MISALTLISVLAAVPAALARNDEWSFALGLNALIWSAMAVGANLAVA